ncbi:dynamin family protein [Ruegeria sp. ANG-S4]|uniref:dynamin family protein n=1 Tax=Ruegeria sp. ANG-S4 TaxID=1577904 RepID=UPI00068E8B5E|nr:dynamin family protein [Ruegeria sp. ANG-S4]
MVKNIQPRFVSPTAWNRIEQWSRRKPVFALMGEFSAGKSTLMNFLLRTQALPTQVTATQLPPVWFSWGKRPAYVKRHDGSTQNIELDDLDSVGVNDAQFVRIFLEADILEAVDLIDTPGISDPKISTDVWQRAVGQANGVLWCTHSTQAWRETERATWVSLPERLQDKSLLLITRADALGQKDRQKVLRRVNREAGHLFNRTILFSARDAIVARDKTGDAELWSRSGGGKMVDSFLEITEQIMDSRADQLARYQIDKSQSGQPRVRPVRPPRPSETRAEPAPLKLVDSVDEAAHTEVDVVTSFPVRPARVERKSDDTERARIDANEADRMRAEMVQEEEENSKEELRAFFRDTADDPLDLRALANPILDADEFEFSDDDEDDAEEPELIVIGQDEEDSKPEDAEKPEQDIEQSISSITALLAEQTKSKDDDYEPEPDSNALAEVSVVSIGPDTSEADDEEPAPTSEHLLQADGSTAPLSALSMWQELVASEPLPEDTVGLKNAFAAFLAEFDQIALEHSEGDPDAALNPVPKEHDTVTVERHVL